MLLQEELLGRANYRWAMLIACVLLNRARGVQVRPILRSVLNTWSTPRELAGADPTMISAMIRPLGLAASRAAVAGTVSRALPETIQQAAQIRGIGMYALDSWRIFVDGDRNIRPRDNKLCAYLRDPALPMIDRSYAILLASTAQKKQIPEMIDDCMKLVAHPGVPADWQKLVNAALGLHRGVHLYSCARLLGDKHQAYGARSLILTEGRGVAIRMVDKLCRIERLSKLTIAAEKADEMNEPASDTKMDLINYAILGLLLSCGELLCVG